MEYIQPEVRTLGLRKTVTVHELGRIRTGVRYERRKYLIKIHNSASAAS